MKSLVLCGREGSDLAAYHRLLLSTLKTTAFETGGNMKEMEKDQTYFIVT